MAYETIEIETHGRVGLIRLNRPKAMNALNAALVAELATAIDACEADDEIGCIVLTGSDKAFAAGADIKEMAEKSYMDMHLENFLVLGWERIATAPQTDHRRCRRLCAGRRLRARDDVRFHPGRR